MIYGSLFKRLFDILLSAMILLLIWPLLLLTVIGIKLSSPGPVFFRQTRVGRHERPFDILKFRSMTVNDQRQLSQTQLQDPEVFPLGRVMRRLKIDELPQIINVLLGDMSLVGPRPCMAETVTQMPDWARRRFEVRPGMTGLAQINGNVTIPWEERWRYDVQYVERLSFLLDLGIVLKTVAVVALGEERFRSKV
jgi:undecaprenyl phosphate N,N'-diacetylbacillosamine 1-phosphate transferase